MHFFHSLSLIFDLFRSFSLSFPLIHVYISGDIKISDPFFPVLIIIVGTKRNHSSASQAYRLYLFSAVAPNKFSSKIQFSISDRIIQLNDKSKQFLSSCSHAYIKIAIDLHRCDYTCPFYTISMLILSWFEHFWSMPTHLIFDSTGYRSIQNVMNWNVHGGTFLFLFVTQYLFTHKPNRYHIHPSSFHDIP